MKRIIFQIIKYFVLPITIYLSFKTSIEHLILKFVVTPFFENLRESNFVYDIAVVSLFACLIYPILSKLFKGAKLPFNWLCLALVYSIIYLYYRIAGVPFKFLNFSFWGSFKLLDLLSLIPVICLGGSIILHCRKSAKRISTTNDESKGFSVDEATEVSDEKDLLNRKKFIQEIVSKIKHTNSENGSFPIGIVAKWGAGKSTFIKTLINEFPNDEYVVMQFNVWKCSSPAQTIETFFNQLKEELEQYSFTINNKIQDYSRNLLKGSKYEVLGGVKAVTDLFNSDSSLEKQYDRLNAEIKSIGRKIIVTIDDLDRLDKKEVYEVIRLIRNTASFTNTFFIVAYDRNYLLNAVEEINPYQSHYFLEKIFQLEFTLPSISDEVIEKEITNRISLFLKPKDLQGYKDLVENGKPFFNYGDTDLTKFFIHNFRDIIRFLNSLKLSYDFVKEEVYFPDFYNLELIKFKHPELFSEIYRESEGLISTSSDVNGFYTENTMSLTKVITDGKETDVTRLEEFINVRKSIYKLSTLEINLICNAYNSIFVNPNSTFTERKKSPSHHLTVIKPSMFDRYFILGIENNLSEVEFSKARELPLEGFKQKLTEFASNENYLYETKERLENIQNFDSLEDFKKVIFGFFHFANSPNPNSEHDIEIGFNTETLSKILGAKKNVNLFPSIQDYKSFVFSLLENKSGNYNYSDTFLHALQRTAYYSMQENFSSQEFGQIAFDNFKIAVSKSEKLHNDLWHLLWNCRMRNEQEQLRNEKRVDYPDNPQAIKIFKDFIEEKDMDGFLLSSIKELPFDQKFAIEGAIRPLYESVPLFIEFLESYTGHSLYKSEFLKLYKELNSNPEYKEGVPLNFFNIMPVKVQNRT